MIDPALAAKARSAAVKATRADWLDLALRALAIDGVDHVTVLGLGEKLRVSRSSFYWYFKNRDQLLDALLDRWDRLNTRSILDSAETPAGTVNQAVLNAFRLWGNPAIFSPRLDFAVRDWSRRSAHVRKAIERADRSRTESFRAMFARFGYEDRDTFVRARVLYSMQIGYWALDLREPMEARLKLTAHYLKAFTGVSPSEAQIGAFRAYARAHAHLADFEPSRAPT